MGDPVSSLFDDKKISTRSSRERRFKIEKKLDKELVERFCDTRGLLRYADELNSVSNIANQSLADQGIVNVKPVVREAQKNLFQSILSEKTLFQNYPTQRLDLGNCNDLLDVPLEESIQRFFSTIKLTSQDLEERYTRHLKENGCDDPVFDSNYLQGLISSRKTEKKRNLKKRVKISSSSIPIYIPLKKIKMTIPEDIPSPTMTRYFDIPVPYSKVEKKINEQGSVVYTATVEVPPNMDELLTCLNEEESISRVQDHHRLWMTIAKRDIQRAAHIRQHNFSMKISNAQKVAEIVQREVFNGISKITHSDVSNRSKALTRIVYYHIRRNERDWKKKAEKEVDMERKQMEDKEERERQQKKLNFLLTQTELYSHFMAKKMGVDGEIASDITENGTDSDKAKETALRAYQAHQQKLRDFETSANKFRKTEKRKTGGLVTTNVPTTNQVKGSQVEMVKQPQRLLGTLKGYQIKGLNWLVDLYEQGINGILADEMGLGKTVQTISLLAHLAEEKNIWGPFIVIAPTSTLPNWANEVSKFCPHFKVLPYWGSQKQRSILRKGLNAKYLSREDSPFHVVVTSYNLIVLDEKYFKRIHWEYMVLDEAHAIKNSSSIRWNTLLGFERCRNRLLLTGTPIQNNMGELWALLHFIMPTLFDSHNEFYEWFSKDIEQHAEGAKKGLDEHQLNRLRMILKPFMLRRVKQDVENEMPPKYEKEIRCYMTARQQHLYQGVRKKISIGELLNKSLSDKQAKHLMNLVMQFRKVCNHPEILDRTETTSPFQFAAPVPPHLPYNPNITTVNRNPIELSIPRIIYKEALMNLAEDMSGSPQGFKNKWLYNRLSIYSQSNIYESIFSRKYKSNCWSFSRLFDLSPNEIEWIALSNAFYRMVYILSEQKREEEIHYLHSIPESGQFPHLMLKLNYTNPVSPQNVRNSPLIQEIVRTDPMTRYNKHCDLIASTKVYRPTVIAAPVTFTCLSKSFVYQQHSALHHSFIKRMMLGWAPTRNAPDDMFRMPASIKPFNFADFTPLARSLYHIYGGSYIRVPQFSELVRDCAKLKVFDGLLKQLKKEGHRVLVYSQMTAMLDILEDFLYVRGHKFIRLDGSSKLDDRRDMMDSFQTDNSIFVFLLSTRAGGLGINLTAADTVIFYDSDWNPTNDAQAMDRAHRLGQTKPVTVYRLVTANTVEEKIIQRAKQKGTIHNIVIAGGKSENESEGEDTDIFKPNEVVDILLEEKDAEELRKKKHRSKLKRMSHTKRSSKPVRQEEISPSASGVITVDAESIK